MATFVLVVGAWHGAWAWDRVVGPLREQGHRVITPTLTGLGERADELTPEVGLDTHVDDVCAVLAELESEQVILVGHSYAGLVVRGAADRMPERVAHLVLVDAWIADNGESLFDVAPEWFGKAMVASAQRGDGVGIPAPAPENFGVTDSEDAAWVGERVTPHPLRSFSDAARLTGTVDSVSTTALVCRPGNGMPFAELAEKHGLPVVELTSGHSPMVTVPDQVVRRLLEAAERATV